MERLLGSRARKSEQSSTSAQAQQRTPTPTQHTHTKNISTLTAKEEKAPLFHRAEAINSSARGRKLRAACLMLCCCAGMMLVGAVPVHVTP
jgi:hypothetical protein